MPRRHALKHRKTGRKTGNRKLKSANETAAVKMAEVPLVPRRRDLRRHEEAVAPPP